MKILYVTAIELDSEGGPKTHITEMIRHWHQLGHDILLLAPRFDRESLKLPAHIVNFPFGGYSFGRRLITYVFLFFALIRCITRHKPAVVYERQMEYNPFVALACRLMKLPLFIEINGLIAEDLAHTGTANPIVRVHQYIEKKELAAAAGAVCTSSLLRDKLGARNSRTASKLCFIPNGVNLAIFRPMNKGRCRARIGLAADLKYVGYMGTFSFLHQPEQAVESFVYIQEKHPDTRLVLVGDGPRKKNCEKLAAYYGLKKFVIFTGAMKYEDVPVVLNCLDVALGLASRTRLEREGVVAFKFQEFMACGCPTISQYLDPLDYKRFSAFVKMVHVDDKPGLVAAILELLEDPDTGSSMAQRALAYMKDNVSWERSARMSIEFMDRKRSAK